MCIKVQIFNYRIIFLSRSLWIIFLKFIMTTFTPYWATFPHVLETTLSRCSITMKGIVEVWEFIYACYKRKGFNFLFWTKCTWTLLKYFYIQYYFDEELKFKNWLGCMFWPIWHYWRRLGLTFPLKRNMLCIFL